MSWFMCAVGREKVASTKFDKTGRCGQADNTMPRNGTINDSGGTLAAYTYLSAGTIARATHPGPQVSLDHSAEWWTGLTRAKAGTRPTSAGSCGNGCAPRTTRIPGPP